MFGTVIGIDPGAGGGIAWCKGKGTRHTKAVKMPPDFSSLNTFIKEIDNDLSRCLCVLEQIQMHPGSAQNPGMAMRMQKLLRNHEQLKTLLQVHHIQVIEVPPVTWQTELNLKMSKAQAKKESDTVRKNRYKHFAQSKFPHVKATLWNSDALCLLYLGLYKLNFHEQWIKDRLAPSDLDLL
jgi:hypothetical protein